jgi:hypothetical protein
MNGGLPFFENGCSRYSSWVVRAELFISKLNAGFQRSQSITISILGPKCGTGSIYWPGCLDVLDPIHHLRLQPFHPSPLIPVCRCCPIHNGQCLWMILSSHRALVFQETAPLLHYVSLHYKDIRRPTFHCNSTLSRPPPGLKFLAPQDELSVR